MKRLRTSFFGASSGTRSHSMIRLIAPHTASFEAPVAARIQSFEFCANAVAVPAVLQADELRLAVLVPVHSAVPVQRPVPAHPRLAQRPVLARWVLQPAVPVDPLLSRRSFSAAMAGS